MTEILFHCDILLTNEFLNEVSMWNDLVDLVAALPRQLNGNAVDRG